MSFESRPDITVITEIDEGRGNADHVMPRRLGAAAAVAQNMVYTGGATATLPLHILSATAAPDALRTRSFQTNRYIGGQ